MPVKEQCGVIDPYVKEYGIKQKLNRDYRLDDICSCKLSSTKNGDNQYIFIPIVNTLCQMCHKKLVTFLEEKASGYGVACWQHQFSSITEVKQHMPALVVGWVTASVEPFEQRPLVL